MSCEFKDGTLTIRSGRDDTDVGWVVDGGDYAGCEDDFLPGLMLAVRSYVGLQLSRQLCVESVAYHVFEMLMTLIPSGRVFQRYGSM
jgi:hypothetical protein